MAEAGPDTEEILAALVQLVARWSSTEMQVAVAQGMGIRLDAAALRAVYTLGLHDAPMMPSALADQLHLTRPTTSKLLARLGSEGLVERVNSPSDGRAALLTLTDSGREVYDRLVTAGHSMIADALTGWSADEVDTFRARLLDFVGGLPTPTPPALAAGARTKPEKKEQ